MGQGLLNVSFVLNKQGGGAGTELITAQVKSRQFRRGGLVGSPCTPALVFYLQTCSIALPRSIALGVRAGRLQAFSLSLKKSVTCSSRWARAHIYTHTLRAQVIQEEKSFTSPLKPTPSQTMISSIWSPRWIISKGIHGNRKVPGPCALSHHAPEWKSCNFWARKKKTTKNPPKHYKTPGAV